MKKVGIIGHFGKNKGQISGQIIKTENLHSALKKYTDFDVATVDTHGWKKHPFKLYKAIKNAFAECDAVIMLPAHNGIRVFTPFLCKFKKKYNKKIYYDVIGGWLPEFLERKNTLSKQLKSFDGIWVETIAMKERLCKMGFENISLVPNFKDLSLICKDDIVCDSTLPLKLCTFSRVMRQKGVEDAVDAVRAVNDKLGICAFTLDIYGSIEKREQEWFENLQDKLGDGICTYKGVIDSEKSVDVLKDYFALVFPTHYKTEGIPGTIIDAYCAALPVISSRWQGFFDCIDEGKSGIGYELCNVGDLEKILCDVADKPEYINGFKEYCLKKAKGFTANSVIVKIEELLNEK